MDNPLLNQPLVLDVIGDLDGTACIIRDVIADSAASETGIVSGDRVVAFDDQPIADFKELTNAVSARKLGKVVTLTIVRSGQTMEFEVTLRRRGDTNQPP